MIAGACALAVAGTLASGSAHARPIGYADSTTVMVEHAAGVMDELQVFYSPSARWSVGFGQLEVDSALHGSRAITYARLNVLAKRWNLESAQANIFFWGGAGSVYIPPLTYVVLAPGQPGEHDHGAPPPPTATTFSKPSFRETTWNAGGQVDYETRRVYLSAKTDFHASFRTVEDSTPYFWHRVDTLQLGIAPYEHDVDRLATWFVISGRRYAGNSHASDELALLLRFFKKNFWLEAGSTTDGELRAWTMFSF
jgi:hypothetical protein